MTIKLENVSFSYGNSEVLKEINLSVTSGQIVGFAGLNGAGKSTLLKVIAKRLQPTNGTIHFQENNSIAYVPQEVDEGLVQELTVIENLLIENLRKEKKLLFSKRKSIEFAKQKLIYWNISLPFEKRVRDCSIYEKQMILIAKALLNDSSYFLFDEPTSSLGKTEKELFFSLLSHLKQLGKGIVIILHSIEELLNYTDQISILKYGEIVDQGNSSSFSKNEMIEKMTSDSFSFTKSTKASNETAFQFLHINLVDSIPSINLEIKKSEVVVIYGANGNKKSSLAKTLWGAKKKYEIVKGDKKFRISSPSQAHSLGLAFVPEERRQEGLFLEHSIRENISFHAKGWINKVLEQKKANELIQTLSIYPKDTEKEILHLSGGNQQKVSIAKWISPNTKCLILDEPLKGVDYYAKQHIFQFIDDFCSSGGCVIYFTNDLEEANVIGDRIYTIEQGEILEGIV